MSIKPYSTAQQFPFASMPAGRTHEEGSGMGSLQGAASLPPGGGAAAISSGQHTVSATPSPGSLRHVSPLLLAVMEDTNLSLETVQHISIVLQQQHGRPATLGEMLDLSDDVQEGKVVLPPLPPGTVPNAGQPSPSHASNRSNSTNSMRNSIDSEESQSADDSEEDGGFHSEGEDQIDAGVPVAPSSPRQSNQSGAAALQSSSVAPERLTEAERAQRESAITGSSTGAGVDIPDGNASVETAKLLSPEEQKQRHMQMVLLGLQREFEILDASRKCTQCKVKARDTTFLPCGHFMMCKECSEPVYTCPNCKKSIQATAQTYLS